MTQIHMRHCMISYNQIVGFHHSTIIWSSMICVSFWAFSGAVHSQWHPPKVLYHKGSHPECSRALQWLYLGSHQVPNGTTLHVVSVYILCKRFITHQRTIPLIFMKKIAHPFILSSYFTHNDWRHLTLSHSSNSVAWNLLNGGVLLGTLAQGGGVAWRRDMLLLQNQTLNKYYKIACNHVTSCNNLRIIGQSCTMIQNLNWNVNT